MKDYALINASKMHELTMRLSTVECKVMLGVLFYLSSNDKELYINNAETREFLSSLGIGKTPERICAILSSMVKKGVLKREAQGVFSVPGNLILPASCCED